MFKDVMMGTGLELWAQAALVIFFVVFVAVTIWAWTRPRRDVEAWSALALLDDDDAARAGDRDARGGRR